MAPRRLRDELQARVEAVPKGGEIAWSTYYFRDRRLAQALIDASDRGVRVMLRIEGEPRFPEVNRAVTAMLERHGLNGGLTVHRPPYRWPDKRYGYWHSKIYCFSDPIPTALVGSFNPSGDEPEDKTILADIGDQDRGHNLLLGIERPALTSALRDHVGKLAEWRPWVFKFRPYFNRVTRDWGCRLYFFPRLRACKAEKEISKMGPGDQFRGVISHLKKGQLTRRLRRAVQRGVTVELLVHDTERRVPAKLVEKLRSSGVRITRVVHPEGLAYAREIPADLPRRQIGRLAWQP